MTFSEACHPFRQLAALTIVFVLVGACHGQREREVRSREKATLLTLDFSRDGSKLVAAGNCVRVYDLKSGDLVHTRDSLRAIHTVAFSPAEADLFVTAGDGGFVRFW